MYPILFEIPVLDLPLRSFGVMLALGFLVGHYLLLRLAARYGDDPQGDPERYSKIAMWILVGIVIGARLMYVAVEIARGQETGQAYLADPLKIFAVWEGGLVMYGGLFGGIAGGMWCARRQGVRPLHALDLGLVAGFVGQAIGRVGCLLVGDDFGREVPESLAGLPFPIVLRVPEELPAESLFGAENAGKVLYATQPWMSLNALMLAGIAYLILKRRRYTGQVSLWLILLYAITRGFIEAFRGDSIRGTWSLLGGLSTSQLISLAAGVFAVVLLYRNRGRRDPDSAAPPAPPPPPPAPASEGGTPS